MARSAPKRKILSDAEVSDDEFDGHLEGVLSQSEDEDVDFESDGEPDLDDGSSDDLPEDPDDDDDDNDNEAKETGEDKNERPYKVVTDANGGVRYEYEEIEPVYDSDDSDAQGPVNTIGNIPLSFYDSYPHIGYDINGKKIQRPATGEALDALLDSIELPKGWTGLTDPETGKPLNLSQDELELLRKLQMNEVPEEGYEPYPVSIKPRLYSRSPLTSAGYGALFYQHRRKDAAERGAGAQETIRSIQTRGQACRPAGACHQGGQDSALQGLGGKGQRPRGGGDLLRHLGQRGAPGQRCHAHSGAQADTARIRPQLQPAA